MAQAGMKRYREEVLRGTAWTRGRRKSFQGFQIPRVHALVSMLLIIEHTIQCVLAEVIVRVMIPAVQ